MIILFLDIVIDQLVTVSRKGVFDGTLRVSGFSEMFQVDQITPCFITDKFDHD